MTLINVRVTSSQRQPTLRALAKPLEGECWTAEYAPGGWTWEYAFPTLEQAQQFLATLPVDCQGILELLPSPNAPLERLPSPNAPLEPLDRQPPKLLEFMDWSDRAAALGLRLSRYGTGVFALRREADGELMVDDLTWAQAAALVEQLEDKGNHTET